MNNLVIFAYESGICLAVLFGMYWILLRRETYFRFNRMYLLGSLFLACLFPLGDLSVFDFGQKTSALKIISGMGK